MKAQTLCSRRSLARAAGVALTLGSLAPGVVCLSFAVRAADAPAAESEAAAGAGPVLPWLAWSNASPGPHRAWPARRNLPPPFQVQRVWPELKFKDPVDVCGAPGSGRLFVAEQAGRVYSFAGQADVAKPELFVDLTNAISGVTALYGLAFAGVRN